MGRYKEYWLDKLEDRSVRLCNILGISQEDLDQLDYKIETNYSKNGRRGLVKIPSSMASGMSS